MNYLIVKCCRSRLSFTFTYIIKHALLNFPLFNLLYSLKFMITFALNKGMVSTTQVNHKKPLIYNTSRKQIRSIAFSNIELIFKSLSRNTLNKIVVKL